MPRRRSGQQSNSYQQSGMVNTQSVPNQAYENAAEPTHNGNYAWNGQPIPSYQPFNQMTQANGYGSQASNQLTQANGYGSQTSNQLTQQIGYGSQASNQMTQANGYGSQASNQMTQQNDYGSQSSNQLTQQNGYGSQASNQTLQANGYQSQMANQMTGIGGSSFMPQARDAGGQSFQGGMPVPGSSGNPNAAYGQRNTGINNADARNVGFQGGYTGYGPNGQPVQYGTFMRDGTQYGAGPHTIDPNKLGIRAVRYDGNGISAVQFQDGSVADIAQAIAMAEAGMIEDVNTGRNREGQKTLRSYPDGDPSNNLSNLPRF